MCRASRAMRKTAQPADTAPLPSCGLARPAGNQTTDTFSQRPHIVEQPSASLQSSDCAVRYHFRIPLPYSGPSSGTLKCSGDPVPPNAEYVFPGMPLGNIQVDLDGKPWDARLVPGKGQTQDLILKTKAPARRSDAPCVGKSFRNLEKPRRERWLADSESGRSYSRE